MWRNPMLYVGLAYAFFVAMSLQPMCCPSWVFYATLVGMCASATAALVTGIVQDRAQPSAKRTWRIGLAVLCILVAACWFLLPAL